MELVSSTNPMLTKPCMEFDFANPPFDPIEFAKELVKVMRDNNGIGLAANQVGTPYRVFAMRGTPENLVCYNPKVVHTSDEEVLLDEMCLSYPRLVVKVKRPQHVRVRYTQPNGEVVTQNFTGMTARVFQHEMDHLDGVVFYNRANKYHRDLALKRYNKR